MLTFVWSEFGRRPEANDSAGTDHGAGGVAWVQGTARAPAASSATTRASTSSTREDNLAVTVDFRRVYSSLLEGWLGTDADEVIPNAGAFGRLALAAVRRAAPRRGGARGAGRAPRRRAGAAAPPPRVGVSEREFSLNALPARDPRPARCASS